MVELSPSDDGIWSLILSRPEKRNALDNALLKQLDELLAQASASDARVLCLRARGQAFCAGFDWEGLKRFRPSDELPDSFLGEVLTRLQTHRLPAVALIEGAAYGAGCELALACDFRIASAKASFCMPPARLGIVYSPEGMHRLAQVVGPARAKRMFLSGEKLDAPSALTHGLVDEVHASESAAAGAAENLCRALASGAPLAVQGMKRQFSALFSLRLSEEERSGCEALRRQAFESEDFQEGLSALEENRAPKFRGR
jgi:enoyl-CoA hydratase/carnithine racemase